MRILGIETSCDDTAASLIETDGKYMTILAERTASQIEVHKMYGGVVPEVAGRKHAEQIIPVIDVVIKNHGKPDIIAVTAGPGLMTGLLVGTEIAKSLSYLWDIPVVPVNHIDGHIHTSMLPEQVPEGTFDLRQIVFPALALTVSGGHTELVLMKSHTEFEKIGGTRDDAAGECFDKVGKLIGIDYPGGPKISALAEQGRRDAITFPRPMIDSDNADMSFSGLKTAALYWLRDNDLADNTHRHCEERGTSDAAISDNEKDRHTSATATVRDDETSITKEDFCASLEAAIGDLLVSKTVKSVKQFEPKTVLLVGGVSANTYLRESLRQALPNTNLLIAPRKYGMDNATMIALAGYFIYQNEGATPWQEIQADPQWRIWS